MPRSAAPRQRLPPPLPAEALQAERSGAGTGFATVGQERILTVSPIRPARPIRRCPRIHRSANLHPLWRHFGAMPVNLSIKNAPDHVVQRLRERAARHHRSLQGELMAIIEAAVQEARPSSPAEILAEVRRLGLHTPTEAAAIIRADRDAR